MFTKKDIDRLIEQIELDKAAGKVRSQAQAARAIGVEPQEITNWKARGRIPHEKQKLVCKYYGWSLDYLQFGKQEKQVNEQPGKYQIENLDNATPEELAKIILIYSESDEIKQKALAKLAELPTEKLAGLMALIGDK